MEWVGSSPTVLALQPISLGTILVIVYIAFPPHLERLVVSHNTHTLLGVSLTRNLPLSQLSLSNLLTMFIIYFHNPRPPNPHNQLKYRSYILHKSFCSPSICALICERVWHIGKSRFLFSCSKTSLLNQFFIFKSHHLPRSKISNQFEICDPKWFK